MSADNHPTGPTSLPGKDPKAVAEALRLFFRAQRTLRTYPVDNDINRRALAELGPRLAAVLPLSFNVVAERLEWEDTALVDDRGATPPIVGSLFRDGIRRIRIEAELDADELQRFLIALSRPMDPDDVSEDYVTRLWEAALPHIRISAIDPYLTVDSTEDVLEGKSESAAGLEESEESAAQIPPPPEEAFTISEEDKVRVVKDVQQATNSIRWLDFIGATFDAAATPVGERRQADLAEIIEANFYKLVRDRDLTVAARFVERVKTISPATAGSPFGAMLERMGQPDRLAVLNEVLDDRGCDPKEVQSLVALLAPHSIRAACTFLEQSSSERSRHVYAEALAEIGETIVPVVIERFKQSSGNVRAAYAVTLGRFQGKAVVSTLVNAVTDRDPAVRREVARALAAQTDARAASALSRIALEEVTPELRVIALRGLVNARTTLDYGKLLQRIRSRDYRKLPAEEKSLLFLALGAVADDNVVPVLGKMLKPSWFPSRRRREDWHHAASALAHRGTPAALTALEECTRSSRSDLASVCADALRRAAPRKST